MEFENVNILIKPFRTVGNSSHLCACVRLACTHKYTHTLENQSTVYGGGGGGAFWCRVCCVYGFRVSAWQMVCECVFEQRISPDAKHKTKRNRICLSGSNPYGVGGVGGLVVHAVATCVLTEDGQDNDNATNRHSHMEFCHGNHRIWRYGTWENVVCLSCS